MREPRVFGFSANDVTGKTARLTVGTDIIDYMESSRSFGREDLSDPNADGRFQRRMVAIPDKKGNIVTPMVLTISNQNELYLVRKDDASKNGDGWRLINISQAFNIILGRSVRVRAHAAAWTDDDHVAIAVAVDDGSSERSRVFVAYNLSTCNSDWENIAWIDCGTREDIRVEGIRVLDGGDGVWTTVLVGDRGPNDTLYLLRSNFNQSFSRALVFNPAVTLEEILDFEVAVHPTLGCGIAVLGVSGGVRNLSFRPFPEYKADGSFNTIPPVEPLPCPEGANVLETGLTRQVKKGRRRTYFGSDIYIGGQGIHQIKALNILQATIDGGSIKAAVVASPDRVSNVQDLSVGDAPDGSVSVWWLLQNGDLNVIKKSTAVDVWGEPLRLRVGIQAIAPVHGDEHLTTSLLMIYANGQASFLVRDTSQGIWQERPLTVANPEKVTKVTCYGTTLRVLGEGSIPKPGIKVKVSASVLSSVVLNGNAVFISPTIFFETQTDTNGSISLFDRVQSLTPATYRFEIEGFDKCIDVNPANGIHERFQSMTADELRSATISTPEGKVALLPESFRTGADRNQVDAVAGGLNNLAKLAISSNETVPGVYQVNPGTTFSSNLQPQSLPNGYQWGVTANSNGVQVLSTDAISRLTHFSSVGDFFGNLGDTIVDFFEGIGNWFEEKWDEFKEGVTFILHKIEESGAFQFICKIGNTVKSFFVEQWEQLGSALTWLWNQIKTGLEKVWEFLKFIFDWKDILLVQHAMADFVDEMMLSFQKSAPQIKSHLRRSIDQVISQIDQLREEYGGLPEGLPLSTNGESFLDTIGTVTEPVQTLIDQVTGNSVVAWVINQMEAFANNIIEVEIPSPSSESINTLDAFCQDSLESEIGNLFNAFNQIQSDVVQIFKGSLPPNFGDLSFDTIKELLISLSADSLRTLLIGMGELAVRSLDCVQVIIDLMHDVLFAKIRFPFIEELVKLVTIGSVSIDTSFRLIDAVLLLCAIPATITYKLVFGEPPLEKNDSIVFPYGTVTVQSGADLVRKFEVILGLISAFSKPFSSSLTIAKATVFQDSEKNVREGISSLLSVLDIIFSVIDFGWENYDLITEDIEEQANLIKHFMASLSFLNMGFKVENLRKEFKKKWVPSFIDAGTNSIRLILRSIDYHNADFQEKQELEGINFVQGIFGDLGSVANSLPEFFFGEEKIDSYTIKRQAFVKVGFGCLLISFAGNLAYSICDSPEE